MHKNIELRGTLHFDSFYLKLSSTFYVGHVKNTSQQSSFQDKTNSNMTQQAFPPRHTTTTNPQKTKTPALYGFVA